MTCCVTFWATLYVVCTLFDAARFIMQTSEQTSNTGKINASDKIMLENQKKR